MLGLAFAQYMEPTFGCHQRLIASKRNGGGLLNVCNRVLKDLPKGEKRRSLAVLDIAGDNNGMIAGLLRERIRATGETASSVSRKVYGPN